MYSKFWPKGGLPGILHHYRETLVTFEYTQSTTTYKPHSLLFVGGMGDGLATTSYMADVARALMPTDWSLFTLNLTSDITEIAECIRYIKDYKTSQFGDGKIVLMGHSTGSQCVLHYLYRPNPLTDVLTFDRELQHVQRLPLDGAIMQAPVSDREAIQWVLKWGIGDRSPEECRGAYDKMVAIAREAEDNPHAGGFDVMLPLELTSVIYPADTPISSRRFLSLASPESPRLPREDDLFSSDLSDQELEKTFGMIHSRGLLRGRLMVLISGADQAMPDWVDKEKQLSRWEMATDRNGQVAIWDQEHSGIIPNASHALSDDDQAEPRKYLVERVLAFLRTLGDGAA
ncbi:hypothetical protein HFD88_008327 [Aspergillus terreus]|nr:hypothetical protein HFD88_008327 [Aspergillus terreus]